METVLQTISTGQAPTTGRAVAPGDVVTAPFVMRLRLDDKDVGPSLPAGSTALVAIFTNRVKVSHVIRKVLLRQTAMLHYINPF